MILNIHSQNPELLSVLNKNPNTDLGLYMRPLRNGHIIGNCVSKNQYEVIFQDTKHSYTNYEDNQIDFKSYCSPEVILGILRELFAHLMKPISDVNTTNIGWLEKTIGEIDNISCKIIIENFFIGDNWYRNDEFLLSLYIPGVTVEKTEGINIFRLTVEAENVVQAINLLGTVSFLCAVSNDSNFYIDEGQVEKYSHILTNTKNIPYFVYYLFIKRCCIKSPKIFAKVAPRFEKAYLQYTGDKAVFTVNDTHTDRMQFVRDNVDMDCPVLDFGCGELRHGKYIGKNFKSKMVSYDKDDYSALHEKIKQRFSFDWAFTTDLSTVDVNPTYQLILSEVIEHNTPDVALREIHNLIDYFKVNKIILTTPNKNFNKHYQMNTEFRNDDHVFEFIPREFEEFCEKIGKNVEYFQIGDVVSEDCVTLGAIIKL